MPRREYEWIIGGDNPAGTGAPPTRWPADSISACLVVRNEEALIERCLRSLRGVVDEIIVVHDGPCDDETLAIARRLGCRTFVAPYYGESERHRPFGYAQARGAWLLIIDADEFLSVELRAGLRGLAARDDVDGYRFLWTLWNGHRYITTHGPYRLVLVRKGAFRMAGIVHSRGEVDGTIARIPLHLEHRPAYDNFTIATILAKWRPWARRQANEYVTDLDTLPRFNYPGRVRWTRRRRAMNWLAPLLFVPAGLHTFGHVFRTLRHELGGRAALRYAWTQGFYRAMVTAYVALYRYGWPRRPHLVEDGHSTAQRTAPRVRSFNSARGSHACAGASTPAAPPVRSATLVAMCARAAAVTSSKPSPSSTALRLSPDASRASTAIVNCPGSSDPLRSHAWHERQRP